MKCKDCSVGVLIKCPECGEWVIICNGKELVEYEYWDSDEIKCDGIDIDESRI